MGKKSRSWLKCLEIVYDFYCRQVRASGGKPTQTGFWEHLGATRGKFQKWSKGQWPSVEDLQAIHEKFGFSYSWLVTGEGEMFDTKDRELAAKDEELAAKARLVEEKDAEIARLTNMILVDGAGDKHGSENIGKAADGQG